MASKDCVFGANCRECILGNKNFPADCDDCCEDYYDLASAADAAHKEWQEHLKHVATLDGVRHEARPEGRE